MPQMNLYTTELLEAVGQALRTRGRCVHIWGDYWIKISTGDMIYVTKDSHGFEVMGKLNLSTLDDTIYFSQLLTTPGYERQGIGSLVVTIGILCGHARGFRYARLGETDSNRQKGGHFWTTLHLSPVNNTRCDVALRYMLESQTATARKIGVMVDPNAVLVAFKPTKAATSTTRTRSSSFGR